MKLTTVQTEMLAQKCKHSRWQAVIDSIGLRSYHMIHMKTQGTLGQLCKYKDNVYKDNIFRFGRDKNKL